MAGQGGLGMEQNDLERELETQLENLGYELVELEQLGSKTRPLLRLRIDRPGSEPGKGVTIDDCARVVPPLAEVSPGHVSACIRRP